MAKNDVKVSVSMDASQLTKGARDASNAVKGFGAEVKKTESNVKSIKSEIGKQQSELNKLTNAYRISKNELGANAARTLELKAKIDQTVQSVARLKAEEQQVAAAVKNATVQITNQGNAAAITSAKMNGMSGGIGALGGKFKGLGMMLSSTAGMMGGSLGTVTTGLSSMGGMMGMVGAESGAAAAGIGSAAAATGGLVIAAAAAGLAFKKVYDNTMEFKGALRQLQNGLNITKEQTDAFGDSALKLSNEFGRSSTEIIGAFKAFADSSPGLENNKEALEQVTSSALKLSVALGTDLQSSVTALDTVMSQFNAKASESEHYINVLAAATQNGASNLEYLQEYFSKVGTAASQAGIPVEDMAAAANLLSQKAFDSSKAGAQMSMMIKKLTTQAKSEFNPAIVGLETALDNMSKANLNASEIAELFGKKGQEAGIVLMDNIETLKETAEKYKNAQTAQELFGIQSEKLGEIINRIKNTWNNFMTKLGESAAFNTILNIIKDIMKWFEDLGKKIDEAFNGDATQGYASMLEGVWDALKPILDILGDIIPILVKIYNWIYKVIGFVMKLASIWIKNFMNIKNVFNTVKTFILNAWNSVKNALKDNAAFNAVVKGFRWVRDKVRGVINKIRDWWASFLNWFIDKWNKVMDAMSSTGIDFGGYKIDRVKGSEKVTDDTDNETLGNNKPTRNRDVTDKSSGGSKSGKSGKGGTTKTTKTTPEAAAGSIAALEKEKTEIENALKNGWIPDKDIEAKKQRIKELKEQIEKLNIELGFSEAKPAENSLAGLESQLSELQDKLKKGLIPDDEIEDTNDKINTLTKRISAKKIQLGLEAAPDTDYEKQLSHYKEYVEYNKKLKRYEEDKLRATKKFEEEHAKLQEQYEKGEITLDEFKRKANALSESTQVTLPAVEVFTDNFKEQLNNIPKYLGDMISDLDKQLQENDLDIDARIEISTKKQDLERQRDEIMKGKLSIPAEIEPEYIQTGSIQDMRASYSNASSAISKIMSDYEQGIIKTIKERNEQVNELQRRLTALGMKPIEIELKTKGMEQLESLKNKVGQFQSLMGSLDGVKSFVASIHEGADAFTIFSNAIGAFMSVLDSVNQIMTIFNTLQQASNQIVKQGTQQKEEDTAATMGQTAANAAEAGSEITKAAASGAAAAGQAASQNASLGPLGWILGITSALAIFGAIAGIISQAKGFSTGGIVTGNSTVGDKILARVNSNEMILNPRQQQHLMNIMNGAPIGDNGYGPINTSIKVRGSDLYLALSNYSKNKSLVGKDTGIK